MVKTIYLPKYAQEQLETSDDSSVWAKPIPFSNNPSLEFPVRLKLGRDELEYDPIDNKTMKFYPDRTEPDTIIELLEQLEAKDIPKPKPVKIITPTASKEYLNAVYRCFNNGDAECWAKYHNNKIEVFSQHVFNFCGFGQVSPFHRSQEQCLDKVLQQGAGLYLNRKEVRMCNSSYQSGNGFPHKDERFAFTNQDTISLDGKTYKLFQDHDDGARGWALFAVKNKKGIEVLMEDHCGNIRDEMLSNDLDFIKDLGFKVNFKYLERANHDFYRRTYNPKVEDFVKDFHINEKGKKIKA